MCIFYSFCNICLSKCPLSFHSSICLNYLFFSILTDIYHFFAPKMHFCAIFAQDGILWFFC